MIQFKMYHYQTRIGLKLFNPTKPQMTTVAVAAEDQVWNQELRNLNLM